MNRFLHFFGEFAIAALTILSIFGAIGVIRLIYITLNQ